MWADRCDARRRTRGTPRLGRRVAAPCPEVTTPDPAASRHAVSRMSAAVRPVKRVLRPRGTRHTGGTRTVLGTTSLTAGQPPWPRSGTRQVAQAPTTVSAGARWMSSVLISRSEPCFVNCFVSSSRGGGGSGPGHRMRRSLRRVLGRRSPGEVAAVVPVLGGPGPSTQMSRRVGVCEYPGCAVSALQSQPAGGWTSWRWPTVQRRWRRMRPCGAAVRGAGGRAVEGGVGAATSRCLVRRDSRPVVPVLDYRPPTCRSG